MSRTGRRMVPKGSMWAAGFSVRRPARLAVSSPNMSATRPWETSCRMIDGTRTAKKMISKRVRCTASGAALALGSAVDAEAGGRLGLEAGGRDRLAARLTRAVRAVVELGQGALDLAQRLPQRLGQGLGLASLRGHLARVGEVLVVVQPAVLTDAELAPLLAQAGALLLQGDAQISLSCVARHADQAIELSALWRADEPGRRPGGDARSSPSGTPGSSRSRRAPAAPGP